MAGVRRPLRGSLASSVLATVRPLPSRRSSGWDSFHARSFAMAERKPAKKATQQSAKRTTGKASKGFTDEERAAMKERAQELKADARRGPRGKKDKADGEGDVLAKDRKSV